MDNEVIYLDNAATTKPYKEVVDIMNKYLNEEFYNPSGVYRQSQNIKKLINESREKLSKYLNCDSKDIFFTSCGTESNNWVFKGLTEKYIKAIQRFINDFFKNFAIFYAFSFAKIKAKPSSSAYLAKIVVIANSINSFEVLLFALTIS